MLKISAIYVGTVLGAGFASGQELFLFFVRFSNRGFLGCLVAGFLFALLGGLVCRRAYRLSEKSHQAYLQAVFGRRLAQGLGYVTEVFLCVSFCVMLSGAGALVAAQWGLPGLLGSAGTALLCFLVFCYDLQGLSTINLILTPLMLLGMCFVSLFSEPETVPTFALRVNPDGVFFPYALFYVGYNMLTGAAVLVPASALGTDKKTAAAGGVLGGVLLFGLTVICTRALFFHPSLWQEALPLLSLAQRMGTVTGGAYAVVLYMAMLTTAVSTGFSVCRSVSRSGLPKKTAAGVVCLGALPLSLVEFSVLVRYTYVFFGVLGIFLIAGILWDWYHRQ
ncbi:MAG: hypothetical protein E7402_06035 [Ruminococcaceae bacterium]|nr:hypothetical protein [Oscillospiraceae bacterium]